MLGAGVAGCALAHHLALRGIAPVTVYDPNPPAAGASGRAAGVVTEQLWSRFDVEVTRESHREYAEMCRRWEPAAFFENGFVRVTRDPAVAAILTEALERWRSFGVNVDAIGAETLARRLPAGRFDDIAGAVLSPYDACVTPSSITTIYAEAARGRGVAFDFGQPMTDLVRDGPEFVLRRGMGELRARTLVVAAGAWTKALLLRLGHPLPLVPYRTQAALLRPPGAGAEEFPTIHDLDTDLYVRPEAMGRILGGDGTERVEADPERFVAGGDDAFLAHLADGLSHRLPGFAASEVLRAWAGVCTATPDRRPLVGPVPGVDGLFVMAGFNGFGIMRAGGVARRLADHLADGASEDGPPETLAPVWPGRFTLPHPPFVPRPGFTLEAGDDPRC